MPLSSVHTLPLEKLRSNLSLEGYKSFHASQIFNWVYKLRQSRWDQMTNLPLDLRSYLKENLLVIQLVKKREVLSEDRETVKFLWQLSDNMLVESVLICSEGRRTVCVSSQVGCPARCAFCASGKEGLKRNLTAVEIFEQVYQIDLWLFERQEKVSHVVFMGMGEPFENYEAVVETIRLLIDPNRLALSQRRITVSTVGVVEGINRFSNEGLKTNLVLSLHAPNQHIRQKIIPYARKYPLEDILAAVGNFARITKRDVTYEYTLIRNINDSIEQAKKLAALLKGQQCSVNLIPYNPIEKVRLQRPEKEVIEAFREILLSSNIVTTWRYTKGKDIAAACGQLALQK
ncbi:putative dual-specificity RNA methyltransferase RlmN [Candidatus Rhabdochlamydia oedothoracis]|uniref:Probable dual-specificity RNA methyltransferase RlmN n=1 Tax=Candidatus Rhabdochlamydia oedothoracis TaxID=2720720 RepID=A0ABX8UZT9_9BACT|nr:MULTISPECIES: 23S rRNA (adenine(2503)-C(2))-methyltransferase RlmN [Rhabdochlamydia]KAG6559527.1 putative dual-specificity RNA methyltransferase RlmN [Candidatus Rhabdochlamydia sp. W815]MCL6756759.1 23S rRNA (adenine(2503)-C(2))-methyltransferase RlmN [Candidatus Rhabdochlamydia oedothoracis]QYF48454.1 putative dual-specificity RNA methyltransferase RlmN [Candidatus Rhabdochlamydia oedothoracis]